MVFFKFHLGMMAEQSKYTSTNQAIHNQGHLLFSSTSTAAASFSHYMAVIKSTAAASQKTLHTQSSIAHIA
jgi:hypothetical protein